MESEHWHDRLDHIDRVRSQNGVRSAYLLLDALDDCMIEPCPPRCPTRSEQPRRAHGHISHSYVSEIVSEAIVILQNTQALLDQD